MLRLSRNDTLPHPGGVEYRYEISATNSFATPLYTSSWEALSATIDMPDLGQTLTNVTFNENQWYHWRVAAKDSSDNESYTISRKFKIKPQPIKYGLSVYEVDNDGNVNLDGEKLYQREGLIRTSAMATGEVSHTMV